MRGYSTARHPRRTKEGCYWKRRLFSSDPESILESNTGGQTYSESLSDIDISFVPMVRGRNIATIVCDRVDIEEIIEIKLTGREEVQSPRLGAFPDPRNDDRTVELIVDTVCALLDVLYMIRIYPQRNGRTLSACEKVGPPRARGLTG